MVYHVVDMRSGRSIGMLMAGCFMCAFGIGFMVPSMLSTSNSVSTQGLANSAGAAEVLTHDPSAAVPIVTPPPSQAYRILFIGDMFFDRYIRKLATRHGDDHLFSCVDDLLKSADMVVGNLEGPITDNDSRSIGTVVGSPNNYVFTFPTTTAQLLARHNIRIVDLGNNHITNFGREGMLDTRKYLDAAGVGHFGGVGGDEPVYRRGGLSFVSYNQFGGNSPELVATTIANEKTSGQTVIVFAHWGEEYVPSPGYLRGVAELFVQSGADAIFGAHPHVVIPAEWINGVPVYYSLGNFLFDQYFDMDVREGLAVLATIDGDSITTTDYPVTIYQDGRTCPSIEGVR